MLEWFAIPVFMSAVAFIPKPEMSDRKKIEHIFKNSGYAIRKKDHMEYPVYKGKTSMKDGETDIGKTYYFGVPLGLPATKMKDIEENMSLFSDGLNKPVKIEYDGFLKVNVYNQKLISEFLYEDVPKPKKDSEEAKQWLVPLGVSLDGIVWHNFDFTPHMTAAGTTRFGKTVYLRMLMTYLIETHPDDVEFYIIDLKGGLEFLRYEKLEQVKYVATNAEEAQMLLESIQEGVESDYELFRKNYWSNIVDTPLKKRRFIIVDEAAQLAPEKWMDKKVQLALLKCQDVIGRMAGISGALGYRIIFATQYPTADTLPRTLKQNADAKISFRLPAGYASEVAIDARGAEMLPSDIKGRALFKTHEITEIQTPYLTHEEMWERLERYQVPVVLEGEAENVIDVEQPQRNDLVQFG